MGRELGNRILIVTGGYINTDFVREYLCSRNYDIIIAADRGLVAADSLGLKIDYIVGDLDSVPQMLVDRYRELFVQVMEYPPEKDMTDTQIAIQLGLSRSPMYIDILGATGARLDHTFGNIHLLMMALNQGVDAFLIDENNRISLKNTDFHMMKADQFGTYISFLPFSWNVKGLSLYGFKYPLDRAFLQSGNSLGISNELVLEQGKVSLEEGILLVIESKD